MDLNTEIGSKITVTEKSSNNGYSSDSEQVKKLLKIGGIYTLENIVIHSSSTDVYLEEFPDMAFNSVNFENIEQ